MAMDSVAIVSSTQTQLRPAWNGAQHIDLISAVVTDVFKGSGLTIDDVDFVIDSDSDVLDGRSISNCGFLGALGAHHKEEARVEEDGLWAALYGLNKFRSGASRVGLIVAYSKPSKSSVDAYWSSQVEPFYQRPVGFGQRPANGLLALNGDFLTGNIRSESERCWQASMRRCFDEADIVVPAHDFRIPMHISEDWWAIPESTAGDLAHTPIERDAA